MSSTNDVVIRAEGLGKRYRIGSRENSYSTLRDSLAGLALAPVRKLRDIARGAPLRRERDTIWALKDVDFEIRRGEVFGIIGSNGAGKSTLLKVLARITEPTSGRVELEGRVGSLLEVGTGFHPELTGRENIYLNGAILGMRRYEIDARFDEIVAFSEIERFLDTPVKRYSSGMYVRLAFAVAAHMESEILLVDEVLAVGDVAFQKKCVGKMSHVAGQGRTVLFVSHNLGLVSSLCNRVAMLQKGRIETVGRPSAAVGSYLQLHSQIGVVDLTDEGVPRSGGGPTRARRLMMIDAQGRPTSSAAWGESVGFEIELEGPPRTELIIGASIRDYRGELILHLTSTDEGYLPVLGGNRLTVVVTMPTMVLNDGTYFVTLWVGDTLNVLHDRVPDCLRFEVASTASGPIRCQAPVRVAARWRTRANGKADVHP